MPTIKLLQKKRDNVPTQRKGKYQDIYQDKRWKKLVAQKKRANPLCERCESLRKVKPMDEVHHKIPFAFGRTPEEVESLAFDWENLESLCEPCHELRHKELK
jgi:5-methylcytosine-specific restriction protein A